MGLQSIQLSDNGLAALDTLPSSTGEWAVLAPEGDFERGLVRDDTRCRIGDCLINVDRRCAFRHQGVDKLMGQERVGTVVATFSMS